jgi:hypothetical protein
MTARVYIDRASGTWGSAGGLVIGEITADQEERLMEGSDSEINEVGDEVAEQQGADLVHLTLEEAETLSLDINSITFYHQDHETVQRIKSVVMRLVNELEQAKV